MSTTTYRYEFNTDIPIEDVETSLVLATLGAESLHGETEVQLDGCHLMDVEKRSCVIDAESPVGKDLNRLFAGFVRREFGRDSFRVRRGQDTPTTTTPSAA